MEVLKVYCYRLILQYDFYWQIPIQVHIHYASFKLVFAEIGAN